MEQDLSTALQQPPYRTFWALWFLVTAGYGVVWAAVIYIWGADDAVTNLIFPISGGFWLGTLQGLALRRYFFVRYWWKWMLSSSTAWLIAWIILMIVGGIALVGSGLNPETDVRGCLVTICGVAGAFFGLVQALYSPARFDPGSWMSANAFAWTVGAFVGGAVGFAVHRVMFLPGRFTESVSSPQYTAGVAVGVFVAMLVIGALTGLAAVWHLRMRFETGPS